MQSNGPVVAISGMVAGIPGQGGAAWAALQYVLGLRELGCEVYFLEEVGSVPGTAAEPSGVASAQARYFRNVCRQFGLESAAALRAAGRSQPLGMSAGELASVARRADILINIAGMWPLRDGFEQVPIRLYLDLDPGFTQIWSAQGIDLHLDGHTHFATVGLALGTAGCPIPTLGRDWIRTLQPVALDYWPVCRDQPRRGITTVANWRSYGALEHGGLHYGQKVHSWRQFMELPRRTDQRITAALAIHPDEAGDLAALQQNGWQLVDPARVAATPDDYQHFIQQSQAELGIAKSGYVVSGSGWFSDRSICYLASGRPVLAQETGFSQFLPGGRGLLAFATVEEALAGIEAVNADYAMHSSMARTLAEEYFASDKVLRPLLAAVGITL